MAVTETTTISWGSRLGGSIRGMLFGGALFIAGFPLLFWNEGRAVGTAKAIDEGEGACVSLETNAKIDPEMNGKLVHLTGKADTKDVLSDETFGVSVTAISLEREVEMYQWIENSKTTETKKLGGKVEKTTTYTYKQGWSSSAIDSSNFKESGHDNPGAIEFPSEKWLASNVSFGAFRLSENQIKRIGSSQTLSFPTSFVCNVARVKVQGGTIYVPNAATRNNEKNNRDVVTMPRVGDMRVTYSVIYPHDISVIAKQQGDTFVDYTAKNGRKLSYLSNGIEDAAAMFASARHGNAILTWILRLAGFLCMYFGFGAILKPLSVLADVLPILGDIVGLGTSLVAGVVAFICSVATIAVAWIFYRPVLGVILLLLAGALAFWLVTKSRAKKAQSQAAQPTF